MITVIFSSYNGERTVGTTLEAFCQLTVPAGGWELIAVDNGSIDSTSAIMQSFLDRLPMRTIIVQDRGKNNAINAALPLAQGDLIVLTDDDVVAEPMWLCELRQCADSHPEIELFGGAIVPRWPRQPEDWILSSVPLGMVYAATDPNLSSGEIEPTRIWGPNMALRQSVFERGLRMNGAVGPDGTEHYAMGSETELTTRLKRMGCRAWFCADARVEHLVRDNQLTRRWILKRFFRIGRSDYLLDYHPGPTRRTIFGVDRWIVRKLAVSLFQAFWYWLMRDMNRALTALTQYYVARGNLHQARLMCHAKREMTGQS
jgi:glycosyltransferase involved in cell wall biosynthesis